MNEEKIIQNSSSSQAKSQISDVEQSVNRPTEESKPYKRLLAYLTLFLLIALVAIGFLTYQNYQLREELSNQTYSTESSQPLPSLTPTSTLPEVTQGISWERYQSPIGISFLKPHNASVTEPQLTADITIESSNNRRENYEIVDGWVIGITYTPKQDAPGSIINRAEESKSYEEKNGCTTTLLTTTLIEGKTAYNFSITNCLHFSSSLYFISSDSTYYGIRADYVGNVEEYKNITDRIITSIIFTK